MTPSTHLWFTRTLFVEYITDIYGESMMDAHRIWMHLVDTLPWRRRSYIVDTGELVLRFKVDDREIDPGTRVDAPEVD